MKNREVVLHPLFSARAMNPLKPREVINTRDVQCSQHLRTQDFEFERKLGSKERLISHYLWRTQGHGQSRGLLR